MRAFWELESNEKVAEVLEAFIRHLKLKEAPLDSKLLASAREAVDDLKNLNTLIPSNSDSIRFLQKTFESNFIALKIVKPEMAEVLNRRLKEISACIDGEAYLATTIMAGSLLEGLLFELANNYIQIFNQSSCSPKNREGRVKKFYDWSLEDFINVAYNTGYISLDMKKFSSSLRDFRNYIHPQEQVKFIFNPDKHTAAITMQVLKAAIADISKERRQLRSITSHRSIAFQSKVLNLSLHLQSELRLQSYN